MDSLEYIIVGFDGSDASAEAVREAVRIAADCGSGLCILEVLYAELVAEIERQTAVEEEDVLAARRVRLEHELERIFGRPLPESIGREVLLGHPFGELTKACEERAADLLVLGATGTTGLHHRTLGAVATTAIRHAPCEVLVVRGSIDGGIRVIVCGIDFSENSALALRQSAVVARKEGARLHLVAIHTPSWLRFAQETGGDLHLPDSVADKYVAELQIRLADFVFEHLEDLEGSTVEVVEAMSPAAGLCDYAAKEEADLIVVGMVGRSKDEVRAVGSTAEHVIRDAACSVLMVRP